MKVMGHRCLPDEEKPRTCSFYIHTCTCTHICPPHRHLNSGRRAESRSTHAVSSASPPRHPRSSHGWHCWVTFRVIHLQTFSQKNPPWVSGDRGATVILFVVKSHIVNSSYKNTMLGKEAIILASSHLETVNIGKGSLRVELPLNNWVLSGLQG